MTTPSPDDWRRQGQERYLANKRWALRGFSPLRAGWEHEHCEFCGAKFSQATGDLHQGYTTDTSHWVCEPCFGDFRDEMHWAVE